MKVIRVRQISIIRNRDYDAREKVLEITLDDGRIVYSDSARILGECEFIYSRDPFSVRVQTAAQIEIDGGEILK